MKEKDKKKDEEKVEGTIEFKLLMNCVDARVKLAEHRMKSQILKEMVSIKNDMSDLYENYIMLNTKVLEMAKSLYGVSDEEMESMEKEAVGEVMREKRTKH